MTQRQWSYRVRVATLALVMSALTSAASAQVVQVGRGDARHAIGFNLGYFYVKGVESRVDEDVLLADLCLQPSPPFDCSPLLFEVDDFGGFSFGGEWLYGIGNWLETGVGIGYTSRTVHSAYRDLENINGAPILQDLKLKTVPITATIRFLPTGRDATVQPYFGGGIGLFNWKYSEVGEFVDSSDNSIFPARYTADGTAVGPVVVGGIRFAIGDAWLAGTEFQWQKAEGDTNSVESGLLGDKIDLGGWTWKIVTMHIRF
jgi:hypothetical protein